MIVTHCRSQIVGHETPRAEDSSRAALMRRSFGIDVLSCPGARAGCNSSPSSSTASR
ncbi:MAG: hypothetical protein M5U28_16565 [Sandaracinaceae bacterium]|nr:hypothetical protein [Sandaracinaceae bacterium]